MPDLNYTTPLYTFDTSNTSFTATKECYLMGSICGAQLGITSWDGAVSINNTQVFRLYGSGSTNVASSSALTIPLTKLNVGDVVTVSLTRVVANLHVFDIA